MNVEELRSESPALELALAILRVVVFRNLPFARYHSLFRSPVNGPD